MTQVAVGHPRGVAMDTEGRMLSACPALPAWQLGRFHHDLPNANLTFLTSDFYCFWQKQPWTTQWGRAGLDANSLSCREGT